VLTEPKPDAPERFRFTFPRQQRDRLLCVAEFVRSRRLATERDQIDVHGACSNLEDRSKMMELLEPSRIGVTLSEEVQLHAEQSTDAFVLHHPEAKYFNT